MQDNKRHVIIIAGPGGTAFSKEDIEKAAAGFQSQGAKVSVVGDAVTPINLSAVADAVHASNESEDSPTIFLMAHGEAKQGQHYIDFNGRCETSTADFFDVIAANSKDGRRADIFMTSCYGNTAIHDVGKLPVGSELVTLSDQAMSGSDIDGLIDILPSISMTDVKPKSIFNVYTKALRNRMKPAYAISGSPPPQSLDAALLQRLGKKFTADEKNHVQQQLLSIFSSDEVASTLLLIENARHEYSILALDYGKALAVTMALVNKPNSDTCFQRPEVAGSNFQNPNRKLG